MLYIHNPIHSYQPSWSYDPDSILSCLNGCYNIDIQFDHTEVTGYIITIQYNYSETDGQTIMMQYDNNELIFIHSGANMI